MDTVLLGSTGIVANKNGFGALPIQRISEKDAAYLLNKARDAGITYFDTARAYSDSEQKIGTAFNGNFDGIFIATKTQAKNGDDMVKDLETSLRMMKTDCIDVYQFHNPPFCPKPGDGTGLYEAALKAKEQGKIRHISITNHRYWIAEEAIESGLYETLQFPFSYISGDVELKLVEMCKEHNMGFIAMKALSGGLINDSRAAYAFQAQYDSVLPIWGVQREKELDEFISYINNPPRMTDAIKETIEKDRAQIVGEFCRGCGYCMPCPQGIKINECARMSLMIRRAPAKNQLTPEMQAMMAKINDCVNCGACAKKCPYGLDTPNLLKKNLRDYESILRGETKVLTTDARN